MAYRVERLPVPEQLPAVGEALRRHAAACAPAPDDRVIKELAALRVLTKSRAEVDADMDFAFRIYAEKLRAYPADIVLDVLRSQPSHGRFWPAWEELETRLDWRARRRRARLKALAEIYDRMVEAEKKGAAA